MGRIRSFLTGTSMGSAVMFFALQYHVVKSDSGVRVIPRTPQRSLGMAWNDIRGWDAAHWSDRLELAQSLMANGDTDLIAESVASSLGDAAAANSSTLDELRAFLKDSRLNSGMEAGQKTLVALTVDAGWNTPQPLTDEVPQPTLERDPFRTVGSSTSRFSTAQIMEVQRPNLDAAATETVEDAAARIRLQAEQAERRLFGNVLPQTGSTETPAQPATQAPAAAQPKPADEKPVFQEITSELERRASNLMDAAVRGGADAAENGGSIVQGFARGAQDAVDSTIKDAAATAAESGTRSSELLFDPFLN